MEPVIYNSFMRDFFLLIFGIFAGAFLSLFTTYINKHLEEDKDKKIMAAAIMGEVKINQTKLSPISNLYEKHGNVVVGIKIDVKKIKYAYKLAFDNYVFTAYINKIGLLPVNNREYTLDYYSKLRDLENEFKYLTPVDSTDLFEITIKEEQTFEWYKKANEAYKLGDKLAEDLKVLSSGIWY